MAGADLASAVLLLVVAGAGLSALLHPGSRLRLRERVPLMKRPMVDVVAPLPGEVSPLPPPQPGDGGRALPPSVSIDCRWHESLLHGWCAPPSRRQRMRVRGAVWRGGSHAAAGTEGQDAVGAAWDPATGTLFLAVADGLGSLPESGTFASEAVTATLDLCTRPPGDAPFDKQGRRLFEAVAAGMRRAFGAGAAADGGTTLLVAEVRPDDDGALVTVHGVGDSEAWVLEKGGWLPLHRERRVRDLAVEYEDNVTRELLTDPDPLTRQHRLHRGSMLLLATDGFAERIAEQSRWSRQLMDLWRWVPQPIDFLRTVAGPGDDDYSDDRGVVAVWVD